MKFSKQQKINKTIYEVVNSNRLSSKYKKIYFLMLPDIVNILIEYIYQSINNNKDDIFSLRLIKILKEPGVKKNSIIRFFKHNLITKENYLPLNFIKNNSSISWLSDEIINDYIKINNLNIIKTRKDDWFKNIKKNSLINDHNLSKFFGNLFCDNYSKILDLLNLNQNNNIISQIEQSGHQLSNWFNTQFYCIRNKPIINNFLSGTMGSPTNRLMADYVKDNKGKVITFDHGTSSGLWVNKYQANIESNLTDEFITFGPKMIDGLKINFYNKPNNKINFSWAKIFQNNKKILNNKFNAKFVYVTATYDLNIITDNLYNDDLQFEWQKKLFSYFEEIKLDYCIKIHPNYQKESLAKLKKISNARIFTDDLNSFFYDNNILMFDNPQSSSFRDSIKKKCKILIFQMPRIIFFNHVLKDLKKRCEIIKIDEINNGFDISIEKLSASIDLVQRKSYEISSLDEYFFDFSNSF